MGYTRPSFDENPRDSARATPKRLDSMRLADVAARVPRRAAFLGALFAALITLPGLGLGTLWDNSETAYGEVAREVLIYHDWLVMHLNGEPWFVQPPLYFWLAAVFAKIFGVGAFAMRLPSALATIAMGGAVGYAAARIAGARAGMYAAVILSTSLMQAIVGRLAIMDALLDLSVTGALLWWFRAFAPSRSADAFDARKRTAAFVSGAAALALGTLAKGPVAPVIVLLVAAVWLVWERRVSGSIALPKPAQLGVALVVFGAIALPWFVLLFAHVGPRAMGELIGHYTVGRYTGVIENQRGPWFYYLPVLVLGFFPWIAFVPMGLARAWQTAHSPDGALARLAIVWTVLPFAELHRAHFPGARDHRRVVVRADQSRCGPACRAHLGCRRAAHRRVHRVRHRCVRPQQQIGHQCRRAAIGRPRGGHVGRLARDRCGNRAPGVARDGAVCPWSHGAGPRVVHRFHRGTGR
jgi:4-amino-4-deoxy-L-arabinose transferase-like glycosyltransferase